MSLDLSARIASAAAGLSSPDWIRATLLLSLIAAGQLTAVCIYLARGTRKAHFGFWAVAWLLYAGYRVMAYRLHTWPGQWAWLWIEFGCLGVSGLFLLLGMLHLTGHERRQSLVVAGVAGVMGWSGYAASALPESVWNAAPLMALLAGGCAWAGTHYGRKRPVTRANQLLAFSWFAWGFCSLLFTYVGVAGTAKGIEHLIMPVLTLLVGMALMLKEEAALAEDKYRGVLEGTAEALFLVDLWTQQVLDANKAACRLTKYSREELLRRTFLELCPDLRKNGESLLDVRSMFNTVFKPYSEFHILRADHSPVICEGDATLAQWRKQAVLQLTVREVDKSQTTNQLMRRTEKLSSLGQLVAGVAHELNNPLAVVVGYSQVMAKANDLDEKVRGNVLRILHESERAAKIVRDLLSFARPCEPQMTTVDVNRLICNVLDIRESDLRGHQIQDQVYLAPDLPPTKADAIQIEQVINNLISNSIHALDAKPPGERRLKITSEVCGFFIRVRVTDSGPGILPAVQEKIFDPFFTTKAPGKGTGLGLSISNTIMEEHHGRIWFESQPGRWTEFYVELPIVACEKPAETVGAPVDVQIEPPVAAVSPATEGRILIVDDEPGIREVLKDVLICSGFVVDTAANGQEALERISSNRYDLIISDLCMPEMDGPALYETVRNQDARLADRIIFVTGDTVSPKSRGFLERTGNRWLSKPFNIRDVEDTVHDVLGRSLQPVG